MPIFVNKIKQYSRVFYHMKLSGKIIFIITSCHIYLDNNSCIIAE